MSRALPPSPPPQNDQAGDYREDKKKRRLPKGHTGELSSSSSRSAHDDLDHMFASLSTRELSSRSAHEDLDDMFASLSIIDGILAQENSGDRCNDRKRKSCQENAGNLNTASPDDVLENMLASLAIWDSRLTSTASTRSGDHGCVILDDNILAEGNSDCTTSTDSKRLRSEVFIERVNDMLLRYDGTRVRVFEVRFDLNSTHAAHLDKWVQFASASGAQCVKFKLGTNMTSCSENLETANCYNFPVHCLGHGQRSSIYKLELKNCIFTPPLDSSAFSSIVRLFLIRVTINESGVENICSCCPILRLLRLGRCDDLVNVRISHEVLLYLDIFCCNKLVSIEIHATSLSFFEYDGHEVHISYASTPNMRVLINKFRDRNCSLPNGLDDLKRIRKLMLTFLSPSEEPSFMRYTKKFTVLQYISLLIVPSWNNVLAVARLLKATPNLKRLRLEARKRDRHIRDDIHRKVSWPEGISLKKLRFIMVGGFTGQAPLIELLACLVCAGSRPRRTYLHINPHRHLCKPLGRWVRADVGDKPARDRVRMDAEEILRSKLPPSVKLVMMK